MGCSDVKYYCTSVFLIVVLLLMLFSSDEDYGDDRTPVLQDDATDDKSSATSWDPSDAASDAATSSTLPASSSDGSLSRYATSSANHITRSSLDATTRPVENSRRDVSFVSRADGDGSGPPWLPASGDTLVPSDGLPSLQHGASGLLALVYNRQPNSSQSSATADHVSDRTAVHYSARSASPSFSQQSSSSSNTTPTVAAAASAQSHMAVNAENSNLRQTDKVISESFAENCQIKLPSSGIEELSPSQHFQPNSVCDSSTLFGGCTSDVTTAMTAIIVDLPNDRSPLCDGDLDQRRLECPTSLHGSVNELPVRTSTAVLHVEDYLLLDSEEARCGLTNGWTNVDDDEVRVLRPHDVDTDAARDVTSEDASQVLATLRSVTQVSDACQSVPINDVLITKLISETAQADSAVDEASTSLRCNDASHNIDHSSVSVNGHLQPTAIDADDQYRVCRSCDDPPLCVHRDDLCDVNSNVTSPTSAVTTSGDDGKLDEIELHEEECQRVAKRLSAAWSNTDQHAGALDNFVHDNGDLASPTSPTLATRSLHVG